MLLSMVRRIVSVTVAAMAALTVVTGCSSSAATVDKDAVAKQISAKLKQQSGKAPKSVSCPDALQAEVGATLRCTLDSGKNVFGVTATVTQVTGSDVEFTIKVDSTPQ